MSMETVAVILLDSQTVLMRLTCSMRSMAGVMSAGTKVLALGRAGFVACDCISSPVSGALLA